MTLLIAPRAQDRGGVRSDRHQPSEIGLDRGPAVAPDPDVGAEQRLGGGRPQADERLGTDDAELGVQPRQARGDLPAIGLLVDAALAARLVAEVLDDVGDVDVAGADSGLLEPWSSTRPAGPTNGCPWISSRSPGCSPTSITLALRAPSPITACVAPSQRSHARHSWRALRMFESEGRFGMGAGPPRSIRRAVLTNSGHTRGLLPGP